MLASLVVRLFGRLLLWCMQLASASIGRSAVGLFVRCFSCLVSIVHSFVLVPARFLSWLLEHCRILVVPNCTPFPPCRSSARCASRA
ncbi:hypothetical protein MtrunA17_Chr7g0238621 [Medicago truncatula]|uniref:Transmembrane protein n=1 Tax=Medicago truncatula TaxID=3880 RepID=A0A396H595_MEDTR|nr:hypothetical protein MtrunA17_Chr7g0238621 [Medicago truncatula]